MHDEYGNDFLSAIRKINEMLEDGTITDGDLLRMPMVRKRLYGSLSEKGNQLIETIKGDQNGTGIEREVKQDTEGAEGSEVQI